MIKRKRSINYLREYNILTSYLNSIDKLYSSENSFRQKDSIDNISNKVKNMLSELERHFNYFEKEHNCKVSDELILQYLVNYINVYKQDISLLFNYKFTNGTLFNSNKLLKIFNNMINGNFKYSYIKKSFVNYLKKYYNNISDRERKNIIDNLKHFQIPLY